MLDIVYEDKYLIVINKPAKLLTISTAQEKEKTLYHLVSLYLKKKNKKNKIFIVHRLDYDTSGLILFAKSENIKEQLQTNWSEVKRKYMAVLEGRLIKREGVIQTYLKETKTLMTYSCKDKNGKLAITEYKVIKYQDNISPFNTFSQEFNSRFRMCDIATNCTQYISEFVYLPLLQTFKEMQKCKTVLIFSLISFM